MKPRLLYVVNTYAPGAIPKILNLILPQLDDFNVKILTLESCNDRFFINQLPQNVHFKSLNTRRLNIIKSLYMLRREIINYSPDIIHSHLGRSDLYSAMCKPKSAKLLTTLHTIRKINLRRGLFNINQIFYRILHFKVDCYICISNRVKNSLKISNKDVIVINNPIEVKKNIIPFDGFNRPFNLLFVGRLESFKNTIIILKAIKELIKKNNDIHLNIIGDGPKLNELNSFIRENRLDKHVSLVGYTNNVEEYYEKSHALIFPSMWSSGIPLVVLEAAQYNTAIISSEIDGVKEFLIHQNNALLFKSNNSQSLIAAISELKDDVKLRNKLAENIYNAVKNNYLIEETSKAYISIYKKLSA
jgi:glycosyltransferase involved in cell wall biosynthesis